MSIFGTIMSKIFGGSAAAAPAGAPASSAGAASTPAGSGGVAPCMGGADLGTGASSAATAATQAGASGAGTGGAASGAPVEVGAVLSQMAAKNPQTLDWKHSIVDLMKLLGMDSSLHARQQLAYELGFTGDKGDSATMNMWLSKQVMAKLAENGGKLPDDLRH